MTETLLVIDPQPALARELEAALDASEARVVRADSAAEAMPHVDYGWVDLVVLAPGCAGLDGYDIVPQLRRRFPRLAIAFAAEGSSEALAREALARGVREILPRPIDATALALVLQRTRDHQRRVRTQGLLRRELRHVLGDRPIVAASSSMIRVLEAVERAAARATPVLIRGELGTGKESVARAVHAQSSRHEGPFVALACDGASARHLASELFGRARGDGAVAGPARRGLLAEARGGTLFLDEIGALPETLQARLARSLEAGAIEVGDAELPVDLDVRLLASTQRDLERESKAGRFDAALLALFASAHIDVPPLRERRDDVPLLTDHILARLAARHGKELRGVADDALDCLARYAWPGNVRELENTLERALLLGAGARIERRDLPEVVTRSGRAEDDDVWALRTARRAAETVAIRRALRATGGNRTHAARRLRISQRALLYKLKEYGIRD